MIKIECTVMLITILFTNTNCKVQKNCKLFTWRYSSIRSLESKLDTNRLKIQIFRMNKWNSPRQSFKRLAIL